MAELVDPRTGEIYRNVPDDEVAHAQAQWGLITPQDHALRQQYGDAASQAKAAGEIAVQTATFGLVGDESQGTKDAIKVFRAESPTLAALTEVAGSAVPGAAGGALAGAAMRGLGMAGRAANIGTIVAEDVAQSASIARQHAAEAGTDIELADVVSGIPLALGMSSAARIGNAAKHFDPAAAGRAVGGKTRELFGAARREAVDLAEAVAPEANAISRGANTTRARRSVGAAGATDEARIPLPDKDARHIVENYDDVVREAEKFGGDAVDDIVGQGDAFGEVHNISHKKTDYAGKMGDADRDNVAKFTDKRLKSLDELADHFEAEGHVSVAKQVREHVKRIEDAYPLINDAPDDVANAWDGAKRTLDRAQSKYGAMKDVRAEALAQRINEAVEPIRKGLEHEKTWGRMWSEKQATENALWSGKRGLIRQGSIWQKEFLERMPGAAGTERVGIHEMPRFQVRGDIATHALNLTDREFGRTMAALDDWIEAAEKMSLTKVELGADSVSKTPVVRLQRGLDDLKKFRDELYDIKDAKTRPGAKEIMTQQASRGAARAQGETLFEAAKELPGIGSALKAAERAKLAATGEGFFKTPLGPARPELTNEMARKAVEGRRAARTPGYRAPRGNVPPPAPAGGAIPPPGPRRVDDLPGSAATSTGSAPGARERQAGSASVGAMAGAAGLTVAALAASPVTQLLSGLSEDSRAVRERAALGLMAPATRPRPLPSTIERFREGDRSLTESFALKRDELIQALQDPGALLAGLDESFGAIADEHPDLYGGVLARAHAAAQYCMAEAPPSVSIGLTRPSGIDPDPLALAKFADIWSGAFNPGDVIYDVGTGDATPTQVRALKDVHPDIYDSLRLDILKQVGEGGSSIPFETLRKLDVLFDIPGIAGPAFSPALSQALQAPAKKPSASAAPPNNAPASATAKFATGPSNMAG